MVSLDTTLIQFNTTFCANPTFHCINPTHFCHNHSFNCIPYTRINCGIACSVHVSCYGHTPPVTCQYGSCGISEITTWKTTSPIRYEVEQFQESELATFKTDLAELQKYVDQKLQRSPEELDMLETKLNEAIEEIRVQKAGLKDGQ